MNRQVLCAIITAHFSGGYFNGKHLQTLAPLGIARRKRAECLHGGEGGGGLCIMRKTPRGFSDFKPNGEREGTIYITILGAVNNEERIPHADLIYWVAALSF